MTTFKQPIGVVTVGSAPLDSADEVFNTFSKALPGRLRTIPDGETGERGNWLAFQAAMFPAQVLPEFWRGKQSSDTERQALTQEMFQPTTYDTAAIDSYAKFVNLRKQGVIPSDVRFQICLPTATACVLCFSSPEYAVEVEPFYEKRYQESLHQIVQHIPNKDMVIQFDMPCELNLLEQEKGRKPSFPSVAWWNPLRPGILERFARNIQSLPAEVDIALHMCYGDMGHVHWLEPEDTSVMVDLINDIVDVVGESHVIDYIHLPVPRNRTDVEYFMPLQKLQIGNARLYLGLVHPHDEAGTKERIRAAQTAYPHPFGVATECGMGRTPKEEVLSILEISRDVTASH